MHRPSFGEVPYSASERAAGGGPWVKREREDAVPSRGAILVTAAVGATVAVAAAFRAFDVARDASP